MQVRNVYYLPSGRVFAVSARDGYPLECTEMRDVEMDGKAHLEVRETMDPKTIWRHLAPYEKKWLLTVSTQKGCSFNCRFCDVAGLPFKGNLTREEIEEQIGFILEATPYVSESSKVKIGFARMGEPAFNLKNVLEAIERLPDISAARGKKFDWLPCFNSVLPRAVPGTLETVLELKERIGGRMHVQISCNSTDEATRKDLFGGGDALSLEEVVEIVKKTKITARTVTLNFIVMKGIEVDPGKLRKMGLSGDKFAVKLIPLNRTENAEKAGLETYANYSNYEKLLELKKEFEQTGVPVVVDAIAKCEEAGLCCGQIVGSLL